MACAQVRIDYPAFEHGEEPPELGARAAPPFVRPLTAVLPHAFEPETGGESIVMLGAPHGATHWEAIHAVRYEEDLEREALRLGKEEMRVLIPYAGIFCAFARADDLHDDLTAVRAHPLIAREWL